MYLSYTARSRPWLRGLVAGLLALFGAAGPAAAQSGVPFSHITRGWQTQQAMMERHQQARSLPPAQVPAWANPAPEAPRYVGIRDTSGQVRYYQIEGPIQVLPPFRPGVIAHVPPLR